MAFLQSKSSKILLLSSLIFLLGKQASELIEEEDLNEKAAKRYISASLKREYASENGTELNALLPKMSPLNPHYLTIKQRVFQKISLFVDKFKGVGGKI